MIVELERSNGHENPPLDQLTIEHVMPRDYCDDWSEVIEKDKHGKLKDLWANLIPLSESMNGHIDQAKYEVKRPYIEKESMYITARKLGESYSEWNEVSINNRTEALAEWAIERWTKT